MEQTLIITAPLCREYDTEGNNFDFLEDYSFTLEQVYNKEARVFPMDFINWIYCNIPLSDKDKEFCLGIMKIKNCSSFYSCFNIEECSEISESSSCKNSQQVHGSDFITDSKQIYNSTEVEESENIYTSGSIFKSNEIVECSWIYESRNISASFQIHNSTNLAHCKLIVHGHFLVQCDNCVNSMLSRRLKNCNNKILCYDLINNDDYMIFNKVVSERTFQAVCGLLVELLIDKKMISTTKNKDNHYTVLPEITIFYQTFKNEKDFWKQVKEYVINYDQDLLYQITLSEGIFEN